MRATGCKKLASIRTLWCIFLTFVLIKATTFHSIFMLFRACFMLNYKLDYKVYFLGGGGDFLKLNGVTGRQTT